MTKSKTIFLYSVYPVFMLSAWSLILLALQSGVNHYLATVPIIALFGLLAWLLERALPFEQAWLHGPD